MLSKIKILSLIGILVVGMSAVTVQNDKLFEIAKNIEIFVNVYKALNTDFVDELDPGELMGKGIEAMVGSLDPYTNYISESKIEGYRLSNTKKYQGFGAALDKVDDHVTFIEIYEDGPAMKAGIIAGDQIISINGNKTKGKSKDEVNAIAMGAPGTTMALKINRIGQKKPLDVDMTRGESSFPNVPYSGRVADNIGYINLSTFTQGGYKNIKKALQDMKHEGNLDGVILDLRFNGGGLLAEAIDICGIFIEKDIEVVTTKGKVKDRDQSFKTRRPTVDPEIPLVVMINGRSASASEIVSGVMQDLDRGVLIGQRSFGKGLVQNTKDVGYNSKLKLTTSKYYIPSRRCIQAVEYDEKGKPVDIADSRRSKFRTKNGRVVLDGGGVSPDIKLPKPELSEYASWLVSEHIIFKYVNNYVMNHDSIDGPGEFSFEDYNGFETFVNKGSWNFTPKMVSDIEKIINEDKPDVAVKSQLENTVAKIKANHEDDISTYEKEISRAIEIEIISRYYYQSGKAQHRLNGDSEILEAIAVLNDEARYSSILK